MSRGKRTGTWILKTLTSTLCRIDDGQLDLVPESGALIIIINHVGLVELPILYTRLQPRPVTGLAAAYRWKNVITRWLMEAAEAIPVNRDEPGIASMRRVLSRLQSGQQVIISPEGTRSRDGRLRRGKPGIAFLAHRSGLPILPIAHHGSERFVDNLRRLRRTNFHIAVGPKFRVHAQGDKVTSAVRQQMTDEMMYRLAALLPAQYRGEYADLQNATERYLVDVA